MQGETGMIESGFACSGRVWEDLDDDECQRTMAVGNCYWKGNCYY